MSTLLKFFTARHLSQVTVISLTQAHLFLTQINAFFLKVLNVGLLWQSSG